MSPIGLASADTAEARVLEELRDLYERRGFSFVVQPPPEMLPDFLARIRPDAIAKKGDENIVIEVKTGRSAQANDRLADIRARLAEKANWKLSVVYAPNDTHHVSGIPAASRAGVEQRLAAVEDLLAGSHADAAVVMAWSLLEATLNLVQGEAVNNRRNPGQVAHWLAMNGLVDRDEDRTLRRLAELRNRIVHGDLTVGATPADAAALVSIIRSILSQRQE